MARSCSIVPKVNEDKDRDVYLVLDTFGEMGLAWRETDEADTERAALVRDLLDGQYEDPVRIVAFNTAKGWSRDVTEDIADELQEYCADLDEIPVYLQDFLERHPSASRLDRDNGITVMSPLVEERWAGCWAAVEGERRRAVSRSQSCFRQAT